MPAPREGKGMQRGHAQRFLDSSLNQTRPCQLTLLCSMGSVQLITLYIPVAHSTMYQALGALLYLKYCRKKALGGFVGFR